ncbi:MAG: hypothetical protein ABSG90_05705 [Dehalococcoidia bacterium]|jgi:hypothetical protein
MVNNHTKAIAVLMLLIMILMASCQQSLILPADNITENTSQATSLTTQLSTSPPQDRQPIEVISVKGPVPPINPGGPILEITLKNVGSEPVDNLTASLGLDRIFVFHFDVTRSNPLLPNHTISTKLNMFQYQFRDNVLYSLTINGAWQNGGTFVYTRQVTVVNP